MRFLALFLAVAVGTKAIGAPALHVAVQGGDRAEGTEAAPLATVSEALKRWKAASDKPSAILLHGGTYFLKEPVLLNHDFRGSATAPLVIAGAPGEDVRLSGGVTLQPSWCAPVDPTSFAGKRLTAEARSHVLEVKLFDNGVRDYGKLETRGYNLSDTAAAEIVQDGLPMDLARWPNPGRPGEPMGAPVSDNAFRFDGARLRSWNQRQDIWVHGQWKYDWADTHLRVKSIDSVKGVVTLDGDPIYGLEEGRRVIFYNLLEELDTPGEYVIDRLHGRAYVWPLLDPATHPLRLTMAEFPLVSLDGAEHVTFRNLTLEETRTYLAVAENAKEVRFEECRFRNCGQRAVWISGERSGLDRCEIYATGEEGVSLSGGDRATLRPGANFVTNSRIHDTGRFAWGYHPAVHLNHGCGNIVSHNLIDRLNHIAIVFDGNEHEISGNEIRWTCSQTNDTGAIYAGQDWGFRGVRIKGNFIHHVRTTSTEKNAHAIYLDDLVSGQSVQGNILYALDGAGIFCGGGRDVIMRNNLIAEAAIGHYNGDYSRERLTNRKDDPWNFIERLHAEGIRHREEPWKSRYPECAVIPDSFGEILRGTWRNPEGCVFENNLGWRVGQWMVEEDKSGTGIFRVYARIGDNDDSVSPLFDEAASLNRRLRFPELFDRAHPRFESLPFADIGRGDYHTDDASRSPTPPQFLTVEQQQGRWTVRWTDLSNLPAEEERDFTLWRRARTDEDWTKVGRYGRDTDCVFLESSALKRGEFLKVEATNKAGASDSPEIIVP